MANKLLIFFLILSSFANAQITQKKYTADSLVWAKTFAAQSKAIDALALRVTALEKKSTSDSLMWSRMLGVLSKNDDALSSRISVQENRFMYNKSPYIIISKGKTDSIDLDVAGILSNVKPGGDSAAIKILTGRVEQVEVSVSDVKSTLGLHQKDIDQLYTNDRNAAKSAADTSKAFRTAIAVLQQSAGLPYYYFNQSKTYTDGLIVPLKKTSDSVVVVLKGIAPFDPQLILQRLDAVEIKSRLNETNLILLTNKVNGMKVEAKLTIPE